MSKFKVEIDKNACQRFGACVELCPQFFQLSDIDGRSTINGARQVMKENEIVHARTGTGQCVRVRRIMKEKKVAEREKGECPQSPSFPPARCHKT